MKELYHSRKFNNLLKHKIHNMPIHIFKQKHRLYSKIVVGLMSVFYLVSCEEVLETPQEKGIDGVWHCQETHENDGTRNYYIDIEYKSGDSSTVHLINFLDLDRQTVGKTLYIYARVFGKSITIPRQKIEDHTIEGNGVISQSTITLAVILKKRLTTKNIQENEAISNCKIE